MDPSRPPGSVTIQPFGADGLDVLRALVADASLEQEYGDLAAGGLDGQLGDSYCDPALRFLARVEGVPVGFAYSFVLPSGTGSWVMVKLGVSAAHRRRGVGSALLAATLAALRARAGPPREAALAAWQPNPALAGFAARHGFGPARSFWRMERAPGAAPAPRWPAGIEVEVFDGSEQALADWNDSYNLSFAAHWHFVPSDLEHVRRIAELPGFRPDGLALAWRGGACAGFCGCTLRGPRGEVSALGVVPASRGIGLGRALLRRGVLWLRGAGAERVDLTVDGENEGALALYRAEDFAVVRTRELFARPL
ncbi:MAG: GNAT family N-acetyltransferase [Candidatus Eisenbacteria bacterium]|nr:GNAT family N-acetyltransferase [Candidatus Eisenbacteria bacterium]